jgi:hypothetical protein
MAHKLKWSPQPYSSPFFLFISFSLSLAYNEAFDNIMPNGLFDKYFDFDVWTDAYVKRALYCLDIDGVILFSFQFQNGTAVLPCLDFVDPAYLVCRCNLM